jgi:uncharacterized protein YbbK (DUF523 family)
MILVSSCLAGFAVRYDGRAATNSIASWLVSRGQAIAACPEVMAGFSTPREPAEIIGGTGADVLDGTARIIAHSSTNIASGADVTNRFLAGANMTLAVALKQNVRAAFLKDKSPSCGSMTIYDGSFSGAKLPGMGVTAALLERNGIAVFPDSALTVSTVAPYIDEDLRSTLREAFTPLP